jgi:hypothetical protein
MQGQRWRASHTGQGGARRTGCSGKCGAGVRCVMQEAREPRWRARGAEAVVGDANALGSATLQARCKSRGGHCGAGEQCAMHGATVEGVTNGQGGVRRRKEPRRTKRRGSRGGQCCTGAAIDTATHGPSWSSRSGERDAACRVARCGRRGKHGDAGGAVQRPQMGRAWRRSLGVLQQGPQWAERCSSPRGHSDADAPCRLQFATALLTPPPPPRPLHPPPPQTRPHLQQLRVGGCDVPRGGVNARSRKNG